MSEQKRKGRPPLPPGLKKSWSLSMRVPPVIGRQVERAALEAGRSLAGEIEYRLQRSFDQEAMLNDMRRVLSEQRGEPGVTYAFPVPRVAREPWDRPQ